MEIPKANIKMSPRDTLYKKDPKQKKKIEIRVKIKIRQN